VTEIIQINLSRYHRMTGFDEIGFRHAVDEAMKNGYSTYEGIVIDKTTSGLGVAICDPEGYPVAGIGTTYITGWLSDKQWEYCLAQLKETAETIAEDIFYRPDFSPI
jgi:DNA-binding IclR family transcriptional regulator